MRLWIRRWLDWAMNDLLPTSRSRPRGQAVHTRYEKAGLALHDLPVPWNAEAVVVEVLLRLPPAARRKADFAVRMPGRDPVAPESLRAEEDGRYRLLFRLPTPPESAAGELLWRHHLLARVAVPVLQADDFVGGLRLHLPTVAVRLGHQAVAAQTFVASQCRGLVATAVLRSPTALAPLADLGVRAVFRNDRTGTEVEIPVALSSSQLAGKEAVVTAVPPKPPRRSGVWSVAWRVGGRELASCRIQGIAAKRFEQSLRVSDARFVAADKQGAVRAVRQLPAATDLTRVGPCFLVSSKEPGMAGVCKLQVYAQLAGGGSGPLLLEQELLVSDGPTVFAPGLVDVADLGRLCGFELRHKGRPLGGLSLSPVPAAAFNSEGGFRPPTDFAWSTAAEDELSDRLARLMSDGPK